MKNGVKEKSKEVLEEELRIAHEELERTNTELLQLTLELDDRVEDRTRALKNSEEELRKHRDHLRDLVEERTLELKNANSRLKEKLGELSASEERFKGLVITIPDIVYRIDANGMFSFINQAVRKLGYEPEELVGRHFSEIILASEIADISRKHVLDKIRDKSPGTEISPKLFDERRTGDRKTTGLEVRLISKSRKLRPGIVENIGDETVPVEINSAGIWQPSPDLKDKVYVGTVGVIRDVSERRKMEDALLESTARLRSIFEHTEAGLIIIDPATHTITDANPSALRMFGASEKDVMGCICHEYICPAEKGKCPVTDLGNTIEKSERVLITADKREIPILKTVTRITLNGAEHLLESFVDISDLKRSELELARYREHLEDLVKKRTLELKQSQAKLIQTEKVAALGTLTAGIAHELNNPLMGMLNFIQYCLKHTPENDKRHPVLMDAERETKRCSDIVRNLLTFSRTEKEGEEGFRNSNLNGIMQMVLRLLAYRIDTEYIAVNQHIDDSVPDIPIKPGAIQQVFLNIMGNSMDAVKDKSGKKIDIVMAREGDFVSICISDNGHGISPGVMARIYDPFFTTKPPGKGTGLGLSLSYSIIEAHNGRIECESRPGDGCTFRIWLPVHRSD